MWSHPIPSHRQHHYRLLCGVIERALLGEPSTDRVKVIPQHLLMSWTMELQLAPFPSFVSHIGNHLRSPSPDHCGDH